MIVKHLHDRGDDSRGVATRVDIKYRGTTRLSHVPKMLEIIMDGRIIKKCWDRRI